MMDELLEKFGLKYDDLSLEERETLNVWTDAIQKGAVSVDKIKQYLSAMRDGVEQELCKTGHNSKQDIFLKARLRNYMLLEAFLSTPERAKEQLERAVAGLVSKVDK